MSETTDRPALKDDIELRSLDDIEPYGNNPKTHPDDQVDRIINSIREYGWDVPIVVNGDGVIIKGHGRYKAAEKMGLDRVPVIVRADLTPAQERAARIADNKSSESAWDDDTLALELDELLREESVDIEMTGFDDDDELDELLGLLAPPEAPDFDDFDDVGDGGREAVVVIVESDDEAEFVGDWADANDFEWHVSEV